MSIEVSENEEDLEDAGWGRCSAPATIASEMRALLEPMEEDERE